jgi:arginase family enzyme
MAQRVAVIGVPSGAGACGVGQERTPAAIRAAGLIGQLGRVGFEVSDLRDSPIVPWRPDRANPRARNLQAVVDVVRSTTERVTDASPSTTDSTRFERGEIERLGLARVALEQVRGDPEGAASRALELLANRSDRYAIHLDVDVVDFTDAPLSEHPSRDSGLKLDEMLRALKVLASGPGLVAITLAEVNPHNAAADDGLLERFTAALADAISGRLAPESDCLQTRAAGSPAAALPRQPGPADRRGRPLSGGA